MSLTKDENQTGPIKEYTIGHVSKQVDLSQKTIRDYEKMGLIKPRRSPRTNNRIYSDFDIVQIEQISHLIHKQGFTLPCIRRLIQLAPCWNIFDCELKEMCPAYKCVNKHCYEIRKTEGTLCSGPCEQCVIYINRAMSRKKIFERPGSASSIKKAP